MSVRVFKKKKRVFSGTRYADMKFQSENIVSESEDQPKRVGLAAEIHLSCDGCELSQKHMNCTKYSHPEPNGKRHAVFDLNLRLVYGMRAIGRGYEPSKVFCGLMNLPPPHTRPRKHAQILSRAVEAECVRSMKNAAIDAVKANGGSKDICVALDRSWQKRGHSSLNGFTSVTSIDNGKVLDVHVLSKYCLCPQRLENIHEENCVANYQGTSGGMEAVGAEEMFSRSISQYGIRYTKYLRDGDSKGFLKVVEKNPYGSECPVTKLECVGHIQKRMGSRLLKLKSSMAGKKLEDGKGLFGRGRLTNQIITKIQNYYGVAIRRGVGDLPKMKQEVWAEYFHLGSSNESPAHELCDDSWCKYKKFAIENKEYDHTKHTHLPEAVMKAIKPIFQDLANPDLLSKCLHGKTQNQNESFNSVVWERIPKSTFVMCDTLRLGVHDAVVTFNGGNISRCHIFMSMGISPGYFCINAMKKIDTNRIERSDRTYQAFQKKIRKKNTVAKRKLEDLYAEEEGEPSYAAGGF